MLMMVVRESKASTGELMHRDFFYSFHLFFLCLSNSSAVFLLLIRGSHASFQPFGLVTLHLEAMNRRALQHNNLTDIIF